MLNKHRVKEPHRILYLQQLDAELRAMNEAPDRIE
jgi:hypothetical protein